VAHGRSPTHRRRGREAAREGSESEATHPVRLQKLLAAAGFGSRRGAEELIRQGRVSVDGRIARIGDSADPETQRVALDGERIRLEPHRYWLLHKPTGIVTTMSDPHGRQTVMDLLPEGVGRLHPVGRLDRDSSGLLLLTNDGALTQALLHPSHEGEKEYEVTVKGELRENSMRKLARGVRLEEGRTKPARVGSVRFDSARDVTVFRLTLTEGRKRQIRRMMLMLGHPVKKLVRVRIGPLVIGRLAPGRARALRAGEIAALRTYARRLQAPRGRRQTRTPRKGSST